MSAAAAAAANRNVDRKKNGGKTSKKNIYYGETEHMVPDILYRQKDVRDFYETPTVQITVASLIFGNFIVSAINAQVLPKEGSIGKQVFAGFELFFNISFTIELVWNIYGSWLWLFWESGWNWFDFIIVIISLLSQGFPNLPGVTVLRLFRAFRVFRLFKRIKSLKRIIEGVLRALPGVCQAFCVTFIIMGIWSVIGVEFFMNAMPQHFGNFLKCMFTMWQIMTGDSWAAIGGVLIYENDYPLAAIYLLSYIFISSIIMTNVVVAILLDKYLDAGIDESLQITSLEGKWIVTDFENNQLQVNVVASKGKRITSVYKCYVNYKDEEVCFTGWLKNEEDYIYCMFNNSEKMHIQYTLDKNIENKKLLWIPKEGEDGEETEELVKIIWTWTGTNDFWESTGLDSEEIINIDKDMTWTKKPHFPDIKLKQIGSWIKPKELWDLDQSELPLASEIIRADEEDIISEDIYTKETKFQMYKGEQFDEDIESAIESVFDNDSEDKRSIDKVDEQMKKMNLHLHDFSYSLDNKDKTLAFANDPDSSVDSRKGLLDHYHKHEDKKKRHLPATGDHTSSKRRAPENDVDLSSPRTFKNRRPNTRSLGHVSSFTSDTERAEDCSPPKFEYSSTNKVTNGEIEEETETNTTDSQHDNETKDSDNLERIPLEIGTNHENHFRQERQYEDLKYDKDEITADTEEESKGVAFLREYFRKTKDDELDAWEEYVRKQCEKCNVKFLVSDTDDETESITLTKKEEIQQQIKKKRKIGNKIPDELALTSENYILFGQTRTFE